MASKRGNPIRGTLLWWFAAALSLATFGTAARAAERVATAIVFAVDVSGSVNAERYELQRAGIAGIFADERIGFVGRFARQPVIVGVYR
jgi:hypothetical protein